MFLRLVTSKIKDGLLLREHVYFLSSPFILVTRTVHFLFELPFIGWSTTSNLEQPHSAKILSVHQLRETSAKRKGANAFFSHLHLVSCTMYK